MNKGKISCSKDSVGATAPGPWTNRALPSGLMEGRVKLAAAKQNEFLGASYAMRLALYPATQSLFSQTDINWQHNKSTVGEARDSRLWRALPVAQPCRSHASAWRQVTQRRNQNLRRAIRKRAPLNFTRQSAGAEYSARSPGEALASGIGAGGKGDKQ
jgi:hypothetical protein